MGWLMGGNLAWARSGTVAPCQALARRPQPWCSPPARAAASAAPKQLHAIDGRTMLEVVLATVERSGIHTRLVVLGARADRIAAEVPMHGAQVVVSERWADGQAASLRAGLDALPEQIDEALIVLGDGPGLSSEAVTTAGNRNRRTSR